MKLTNEEGYRVFAINCVTGKNYADDYEQCVEKAEELKKAGVNWSEVENTIKDELKSKYPKTQN